MTRSVVGEAKKKRVRFQESALILILLGWGGGKECSCCGSASSEDIKVRFIIFLQPNHRADCYKESVSYFGAHDGAAPKNEEEEEES